MISAKSLIDISTGVQTILGIFTRNFVFAILYLFFKTIIFSRWPIFNKACLYMQFYACLHGNCPVLKPNDDRNKLEYVLCELTGSAVLFHVNNGTVWPWKQYGRRVNEVLYKCFLRFKFLVLNKSLPTMTKIQTGDNWQNHAKISANVLQTNNAFFYVGSVY